MCFVDPATRAFARRGLRLVWLRDCPNRQGGETAKRLCASLCGFDSLYGKVLGKEGFVGLVIVKVVRCEDGRDDRNIGVQLDTHETIDDRFGDELVSVDAPVDHESGSHHRCVVAAIG